MAIQQFFTSRNNGIDDPAEYVGQEGRLWYDPDTNTLRVYDGNPGGQTVGGGGGNGSPGGGNRAVQFNDNGDFGGEAAFTYNKLTDTLTIANAVNSGLFIGSGANLTNLPAANIVGSVPLANEVSNHAQPNITSVGTLTSLTMGGNVLTNANVTYSIGNSTNRFKDIWLASSSIYLGNVQLTSDTNNLIVSGNIIAPIVRVTEQIIVPSTADLIANGNVDFTNSPSINLGNVDTVHISGGNSGYVLSTDGASNLSWIAQSGGGGNTANANYANFAGTSFNVNASNIVGTVANANYSLYSSVVLTGNQSLITGLGTLTSLTTSGNIYANSGTVYGNLFSGDGGLLTNISAAAGTYLLNGSSNVAVLPNGNVTFKVANTANVLTVTSNSIEVVGNSNLGNVVNGNYLISTSGCVTIGNGTVVTTGNTAGIFNSSISNINLGLQSNIVMGSTTGTISARGNLTTNSLSTTNLTATGNINFSSANLSANNFTAASIISSKTAIPVDIDTVIDSFKVYQYRSVKYTIRVGADEGYQAVEVLLVHDGINSIVTIYGSLSTTGDDLVMLSTDLEGDTVFLLASGLGTNVTVNYIGTYVPD